MSNFSFHVNQSAILRDETLTKALLKREQYDIS